jgi:hypothetical protein
LLTAATVPTVKQPYFETYFPKVFFERKLFHSDISNFDTFLLNNLTNKIGANHIKAFLSTPIQFSFMVEKNINCNLQIIARNEHLAELAKQGYCF